METKAPYERTGTAIRRVRPAARRPAAWLLEIYGTSVGKKYAMAISGIVLLGYVLVHMLGNLKMYFGPEDLDHYAEWLRELAVPFFPRTVLLWILRTGLIAAFVVHIHAAYALTRVNWTARAGGYRGARDYVVANYASRTMRWSGIIVGLFVLWHLADLTWGWVNPDFVRGEVYHNTVASLSRIPVSALYIAGNLALGLHIYHGAWSMFQSLGWNNPRFNEWRRWFAVGFAVVVTVGNLSFPIAIMAGLVE